MLEELTAAVARSNSIVESAVILIKGLAAKVGGLPPDQAAIDALAKSLNDEADTLAAAVTGNTPPE